MFKLLLYKIKINAKKNLTPDLYLILPSILTLLKLFGRAVYHLLFPISHLPFPLKSNSIWLLPTSLYAKNSHERHYDLHVAKSRQSLFNLMLFNLQEHLTLVTYPVFLFFQFYSEV